MAYIGTKTPLDANGTWDSEPVPTGRHTFLRGLIQADQDGDLTVELSPDGETWIKVDSVEVSADTGTPFECRVNYAPLVRVSYANGGTKQTSFILSSRLTRDR